MLNNELPSNLLHFWQTSDEVMELLHHAGVSRVVDKSIISDALKFNNKDGMIMSPWIYQDKKYYRATAANLGRKREIHRDQRFRGKGRKKVRVDMNPPKNYFVGRGGANFEAIDEAARMLDDELKKESDRKIQEERVRAEEERARAEEAERIAEEERKRAEAEANRYDGNILISVPKLEAFIQEATTHAAQCGAALELKKRDNNRGAYVEETWRCPCCAGDVTLQNCDRVKTNEVAEGEWSVNDWDKHIWD